MDMEKNASVTRKNENKLKKAGKIIAGANKNYEQKKFAKAGDRKALTAPHASFEEEDDFSIDRAKVEGVLKRFKPNNEPQCPLFSKCGGCQLQQYSYAEQLKIKRQLVIEELKAYPYLSKVKVLPTLGAANPWNYRNKTQFPMGKEAGKLVMGCYAEGTHKIIDADNCLIQDELHNEMLRAVKEVVEKLKLPIYDEDKHTGILRHVVGRVGINGELMLIFVSAIPELRDEKKLVNMLRKRLPKLVSVYLNLQTYHNSVVMGRESRLLWGKQTIFARLGELHFHISPRSFFQINTAQAEVLYNKAREFAQLTGKEILLDVYCGTGTIGLYMAKQARKVIGIEVVKPAVLDAKRNALENKLKNAEFICGDATKVMPKLQEQGVHAEVVVVDPPRAGCTPQVLKAIASIEPERIVYVSCNPATLIRDINQLGRMGYKAETIQPVDLFPQTFHIECVVLLTRAHK